MKIIFECEWRDRQEGSSLRLRRPGSEPLAYTDGNECHVFYLQHAILPCSSLDDGKAKVIEHLRNAGVLVEKSDVNAELLKACKSVNQCYQCQNGLPRQQHMCPDYTDDMPCSGFVDCGRRMGNEILQAVIAKAEATQ